MDQVPRTARNGRLVLIVIGVVAVLAAGAVGGCLATRGGSAHGSAQLRTALRLVPADLTQGRVSSAAATGPKSPAPIRRSPPTTPAARSAWTCRRHGGN